MAITVSTPSAPAKIAPVTEDDKSIKKLVKQKDTLKKTLQEINKYKKEIEKSLSMKSARIVISKWLNIVSVEEESNKLMKELETIRPDLEAKGFAVKIISKNSATMDTSFQISKGGENLTFWMASKDTWPNCIKEVYFQRTWVDEGQIDTIKNVEEFKKELPNLFEEFKKESDTEEAAKRKNRAEQESREIAEKMKDPAVTGLINKIKVLPKVISCVYMGGDTIQVNTRNKYIVKINIKEMSPAKLYLERDNKNVDLGPKSRYFQGGSEFVYDNPDKIVKVVEYVTKL